MSKDIENFRIELKKLAQSVEILENTFLNKGDIKVNVKLKDDDFDSLIRTLKNKLNNGTCLISIGDIDFIFSKK